VEEDSGVADVDIVVVVVRDWSHIWSKGDWMVDARFC
jgi:hypothetical protein